ncbi:MAG: YceH family protein [Phycisphaerales bacterium]|nr:YceH family protein [Phycisphaerales bacterium]
MTMELKPEELRVLGVLIEKSLSQPAYYPMTLNAITNACNQKSNRDPVTSYDERVVSDAMATLRKKGLTDQAEPDRGSRAVRFRHKSEEHFGWNAAQRAIMAELMLRGPQTLGELRGRASRMTHLESQDYARELLKELENADPPLVVEMEREPGKSARRFAHLLGGEVQMPTVHYGPEPVAAPTPSVAPAQSTASPDLESRVDKLEEEIANLRASLAGLRHNLRTAGVLPSDDQA